MKNFFFIDWILIPCFLLTAITGVGTHVAGHGTSHSLWEIWAWTHSLFGLMFAVFAAWHVKMHISWYKLLLKSKSTKNRGTTAILTIIAVVVTLTGGAMFLVSGAHSGIGLWHYQIGILFSLIALWHIIKRLPILRKTLKNN